MKNYNAVNNVKYHFLHIKQVLNHLWYLIVDPLSFFIKFLRTWILNLEKNLSQCYASFASRMLIFSSWNTNYWSVSHLQKKVATGPEGLFEFQIGHLSYKVNYWIDNTASTPFSIVITNKNRIIFTHRKLFLSYLIRGSY